MGTLHTVTLIRLLPMYSSCSRYCLVLIQLLLASLVASCCDGSRISQVAKLRLQKYLAGIPAAFKISSNFSFLSPASFLVFMSETIKERVFGWTASTSSGRVLFKILGVFFNPVLCVILWRFLICLRRPGDWY